MCGYYAHHAGVLRTTNPECILLYALPTVRRLIEPCIKCWHRKCVFFDRLALSNRPQLVRNKNTPHLCKLKDTNAIICICNIIFCNQHLLIVIYAQIVEEKC